PKIPPQEMWDVSEDNPSSHRLLEREDESIVWSKPTSSSSSSSPKSSSSSAASQKMMKRGMMKVLQLWSLLFDPNRGADRYDVEFASKPRPIEESTYSLGAQRFFSWLGRGFSSFYSTEASIHLS